MKGCLDGCYTLFLIGLVVWLPSQLPGPWGVLVYAVMGLWVAIWVTAIIGSALTKPAPIDPAVATNRALAIDGMVALGYTKAQATEAVDAVITPAPEEPGSIVRSALRWSSANKRRTS